MKMLVGASFLMMTLFNIAPVFAAEISLNGIDRAGCTNMSDSKICLTLLLEGKITKGDEVKLRDLITKLPH